MAASALRAAPRSASRWPSLSASSDFLLMKITCGCGHRFALTEAGYFGEDVENILLKLIQAADFDVKKAETGIIYI